MGPVPRRDRALPRDPRLGFFVLSLEEKLAQKRAAEKEASELHAAAVNLRDRYLKSGIDLSAKANREQFAEVDAAFKVADAAKERAAEADVAARTAAFGPAGGRSQTFGARPTPLGEPGRHGEFGPSSGAAFRAAVEQQNAVMQPSGAVEVPNLLQSWLSHPLSPRFESTAVESGTVRRAIETNTFSAYPHRRPSILEIIPNEDVPGRLGGEALAYLRQTVYTPGAAVTAALNTKPTTVVTLERATTSLFTVANISDQIARQLLASFNECQSWIESELTRAVAEACEAYALNGTGSSQPDGIGHVSGTGTQAKGGDNRIDCIRKAITTLQSADIEPDAIAMNPADWQDFDLETDGEGNYLFGSPGARSAPQLWGYPVYPTTALTAGTAIVGNFSLGAKRWSGMSRIAWTEAAGSSDASMNAVRLVAEAGFGFAVTRPANFVLCTGI